MTDTGQRGSSDTGSATVPAPLAKRLRWIAVHLDALGVHVRSRDQEGSTQAWTSDLPPAALLPHVDGEPVRADVRRPHHVRGTGADWPREARLDAQGVGRWPLAYAWPSLASGTTWRWETPGGTRTLEPAAAIAAVLGGVVLAETADPRHLPLTTLVIPNDLSQASQQALIDAGRALGLEVKLLWRPVAAGLAWLDAYGGELLDASTARLVRRRGEVELGDLLCLHLGAEGAEATRLALVAREGVQGWSVLPGRPRPLPEHSAWGEGRLQLERFVAARAGTDHPGLLWQRHWIAPELAQDLAALRLPPEHAGSDPPHAAWLEACARRPAPPASLLFPGQPIPAKERERTAGSALRAAYHARQPIPLLGAVVSGPLAGTYAGRDTLATVLLRQAGVVTSRVLVEGQDQPLGLLAAGAARCMERLEAGRPAYLDTLPVMRLAVMQRGEPTWTSLLQEDDRWVEGGRVWRRQPNLGGLELRAGLDHFDLNIAHEEFATVRMVRSSLPEPPDHTVGVSLAVSIEPGQGNARVEVVPDEEGLFGRRRVWVEWRSMRDTGQDPDTYLVENYPRPFPPLQPRAASDLQWWRAAGRLGALVAWREEEGGCPPLDMLARASAALRDREHGFRDPSTGVTEAAAVDAEGCPPDGAGQSLLDRAVDLLVKLLEVSRPGTKRYDALVRVLGYTSTAHPAFQEHLIKQIRRKEIRLTPTELGACGWSLRDPRAIALFAEVTLARLEGSDARGNNWLRALAQMLRFREHATREIHSQVCERLCRVSIARFTAERQTGQGQFVFRNACMSIVYLLRRRAWDDGFLPPEGELATWIKAEFREAAQQARCNRLTLVGGMVDLASELQRLIDYVDRRGHGLPGMVD